MRRSFSLFWAGLACVVLLSSGCSDPFAAPTRAKPLPRVSETIGTKPIFLIFVVPGTPDGDLQVWAMRAQHEANDKRAVFRVMVPLPTDGADPQPTAVRRAMAEGASALLVYPGESPELPKALAEAEAKGVPVVLLSKPVAAPEGSKPFTVIDVAPFEETAKQIVAATIEDLKKASQPINGTAIVLADKVVDDSSNQRVAALKAAAEAAKFRQIVTVPFDGSNDNSAKLAVLEAVKANPDVSIVLTDSDEGMVGASTARGELKGKPIFFVGGYSDYRTSRIITPPARESCYVEGRFSELGGLAVLTALAKLRGETVAEHAYVTPKFTKTEGAVASEADPKAIVVPAASKPIPKDQKEAFEKNKIDAPKEKE
jgi:ABC-type sugar transport system substrate-binding protein